MSIDDWNDEIVFGSKSVTDKWTIRPSAYALLEDDLGRLAVVRTPEGIFLPGGGIEADETPMSAVVREAMEECGLQVRVGPWIARAVQFVYSQTEKTHFEKRSTFVEAAVEGQRLTPIESDHETVWLNIQSAVESLSHESHRWAADQWRLRTRT